LAQARRLSPFLTLAMQSSKLALYLAMLLGCVHLYGCKSHIAMGEEEETESQLPAEGEGEEEGREMCPECPACGYNFNKPACKDAEPQAPRDLSTNAAEGQMMPKATVLNLAQAAELPLTNVHWHLGAEHKSDAYADGTDSVAYDASHGRRLGDTRERRLAGDVRPGWMCPRDSLTTEQKAPYEFKYCKGDHTVGKTYEVHYVHSSAGFDEEALAEADMETADLLADGLGGAANGRGLLNPMIVVQAQVFQIVNGGATYDDMLHAWPAQSADAVMYTGSTTGPSHTNEVCSPYVITWHVDKSCVQVSPESFDNMCKMMKEEYNMEADLYPHGSRKILDPKFVVPSSKVKPLA